MKTSRLLIVPALFAALTAAAGCQPLIGWFVAQFAPPQKVKALTELPKGKTVLVFVDSKRTLSYEPIKDMLTEQINKQLVDNKIARAVISRDRLLDYLSETSDPNLSRLEVGRKLGADIVLCVEIEEFSVRESEDTPLWNGKMKVNIRVLDVPGVRKLWPEDEPEYLLPQVKLREVEDSSPTYGNIVAKALAIKGADKIAKLFYTHEVPNTGPKD